MVRAFRYGNYAVYVLDERGQRHHRPHAHIKHRGQLVASVFLETLTLFHDHEPLPPGLLTWLEDEQDALLELWVELNEDD